MAVYSNQLFRATSTTGFATLGANTFTATQTITPAANTNALAVTGYSLTGTDTHSLLDLAGTWNVGTTVETAIKLNITDTASGSASLLMDLQVAGASKFSVSKAGNIKTAANALIGSGAQFFAGSGTNVFVDIADAIPGGVEVLNTGVFAWSSTGQATGAADVILARDAAGILAQRNGTTAQTFRLYNTFTDASNYERGVFDWGTTANTLTIGTQNAGTGSNRNVAIVSSGGNITLSVSTTIAQGSGLFFGARSAITSPANNNILLQNNAGTTFGILQFGGTTSSFPALKVSGATLQARLADDSAFAQIAALDHVSENASFMGRTGVTITGGATGNVPTLTAGPVTGNPTKWLPYDDNGTTRYIPSW